MRKLLLPIAAVLVTRASGAGARGNHRGQDHRDGIHPEDRDGQSGDTVEWVNVDKVNHQLVANNGAFASSILRPAAKYSFTFNAAGTYHYHDALKPSLTGTVVVKGPPPSISLGVNTPIIFYGDQTSISGTVSSAKANESVTILAAVRVVRRSRWPRWSPARRAFVYTTTPTASRSTR